MLRLLLLLFAPAFVITLLDKWGVTEYLMTFGPKFLHRSLSCNFCYGYWVSFIFGVLLAISGTVCLIDFFVWIVAATVITNKLA